MEPLTRDNAEEDLGVVLDSQLSFKQHISYVVEKASGTVGLSSVLLRVSAMCTV